MEVLKGYPQTISYPVPSANGTFAVYVGSKKLTDNTFQSVDGLANITLPYAAVATEGEGKVILKFYDSFQQYAKTIDFTVITPYLMLHEIKDIVGTDATDADLRSIERKVRLAIDAYCRQSFGYSLKTLMVRGRDSDILNLPERLDTFVSFLSNEYSLPIYEGILIEEDGWALKRVATFGDGFIWYSGNPIVAPYTGAGRTYNPDYFYAITGYWGYKDVPADIQEAMRMLINDYYCTESMYRDRFIQSMRSQDWQMQFNDGAYRGTGNLQVDNLLNNWVRPGWAIV